MNGEQGGVSRNHVVEYKTIREHMPTHLYHGVTMPKSFVGQSIAGVYINPGTGPCEGTSLKQAKANIPQLIADAGFLPDEVTITTGRKHYGDGCYHFILKYLDMRVDVQMPGLPLEQVRFLDGMNPWQFPRLYVDDSSWLWKFAVDIIKSAFLETEEDE